MFVLFLQKYFFRYNYYNKINIIKIIIYLLKLYYNIFSLLIKL